MALGLALSLAIGVALGLFGGGGSIVTVPLLTYVLGLPPPSAIAASLVVVGVTSAATLVVHWRSGLVAFRAGLPFGIAAMLGAYAGGSVARFVPDSILQLGFGIMMLATARVMLRGRAAVQVREHAATAMLARLVLPGLGVGGVAGLLGAGGGFLIVPTLVMRGGLTMQRAVATSLLVISMQSCAGAVAQGGHTSIPWHIVVPVTTIATLGSVGGGLLVNKVRAEPLQRGFAWLILMIALLAAAARLHFFETVGLGQELFPTVVRKVDLAW